jgi:hypothetical protein
MRTMRLEARRQITQQMLAVLLGISVQAGVGRWKAVVGWFDGD